MVKKREIFYGGPSGRRTSFFFFLLVGGGGGGRAPPRKFFLATPLPVTCEPAAIQVPAGGGSCQLQLQNAAEGRYAFKIKSTNNDHYRVNPVFGFVEPGAAAQVEVTRLEGPPKADDRLEILCNPAAAEATDPKEPFAGGASEFKLELPMSAE